MVAALALITHTRRSPANCRVRSRENAGSSSNNNNCASGRIRCASARECTPSPGPYSAMTRARSKSILLATRSTSACELGTIAAIWRGRFRKRLKKRTLIANANSSPPHFACPAAKAGTASDARQRNPCLRGKEGGISSVIIQLLRPEDTKLWHFWKKKGLTFDSIVYNHKIVNKSCVSRRKVMKPCHA